MRCVRAPQKTVTDCETDYEPANYSANVLPGRCKHATKQYETWKVGLRLIFLRLAEAS